MDISNFRAHLIDHQLIQELTQNYEAKNYAAINAKRPEPDSKEYTLDLDVLTEYLQFVAEEAKEQGFEEVKITVKMGQYPTDRIIGPLQKENTKGFQTICFVPKYKKAGGNSYKTEGDIPGMNYVTITPPNP